MLTRSQHASIEEYAQDLRAGLRIAGRENLDGLESVIRNQGYDWLESYVAGVVSKASGSSVPFADLIKTPSKTVKKTRAVAASAQVRTDKIALANSKLFGSPISKSPSSRAPLSPLGGRSLNVAVPRLLGSPSASQSTSKGVSAKSITADATKPKAKAGGKKGRPRKTPASSQENASAESSASSRSGPSQSSSIRADQASSSTSQTMLRPILPASPNQNSTSRSAKLDSASDRIDAGEGRKPHEAMEVEQNADAEEREQEVEERVDSAPHPAPAPTSATTASAPARLRTVDLSIIAEAEEDRTSVTIPTIDKASIHNLRETVPPSEHVASAPASHPHEEIEAPLIVSAPPIPQKQVRSSWLNKALAANPVPSAQQRTSDSSSRPSNALGMAHRLSTADFPVMRKSLVQPGTLAKRKSGEGMFEAEQVEMDEGRPEKIARVELPAVPVASTSIARPVQPATTPIIATLPAVKPSFARQPSQEIFIHPTPSSSSASAPTVVPAPIIKAATPAPPPVPIEAPITGRPTSDIDRVTKALNDMRKQQEAKDAAKKAGLSVSIAAPPASAGPSRSAATGTGTGFLRGLGTSLGRSLGLTSHKDVEDEERKRRLALEEEEETERKAREEMNEFLRTIDKPEEAEDKEEEVDMEVDEEAEVNESVELDEAPSVIESPIKSATLVQQQQHRDPTPHHGVRSQTPSRPTRQHLMSTTPQGTPPAILSVLPAQPHAQPQTHRSPTKLQPTTKSQATTAAVSVSTVHDRARLFDTAASGPPIAAQPVTATHTRPFLFSPERNGSRQSDAIEIDREDAAHTVAHNVQVKDDLQLATLKPQTGPAEPPRQASEEQQEAELEEEREEVEEEEEEEEEVETLEQPSQGKKVAIIQKSQSTVSLAMSTTSSTGTSMFGQASTIAKKIVGVKPSFGQVKSVALAESANRKEQAAVERRAELKAQRLKNAADRKAEEEQKLREREMEEKAKRQAELEKRKKEAEERKAGIMKQKAERERKEREREAKEAADQAEIDEANRKRKLASSQTRPAPVRPAKRVISVSSSATNLAAGTMKMKEPVKLTKPAGPLASAHGPSKLVPSTFRTVAAPPETPAHQISQASTIRLVGQPQPQPHQAGYQQVTQAQAERKALGPPTRPSAIRASNQVQAIRQSAAVTSQYHAVGTSHTTNVLAQSRLVLQSQLEAEAADIRSEDIVLPDIASEYSDSGDESDSSPAFKRPAWAESPELRAALAAQASKNPDELFGPIRPLRMEELFKAANANKFRSRTSSGNWARDGLRKEEEEEYARRMGFTTGTGNRGW